MQLDPVRRPELPACAEADFARTGFIVAENLLGAATCAALNAQLELVLRGECDGAFGCADKAPKFSA